MEIYFCEISTNLEYRFDIYHLPNVFVRTYFTKPAIKKHDTA